jgi:arsenate reductase
VDKARVLFVCTHNSARSQMAEGLLRQMAGDRFEALSAGTEVAHVRPEAIQVMREIGIDISGQESKSVERFVGEPFSWVITVCDQAREACPYFTGADDTAHWGFDDPSEAQGSEQERLAVFRRVRDEIRDRLRMFIQTARRGELPAPAPTTLRH